MWGSPALPVVVHYSGCQMCRGHSYNGTWTEAGIEQCATAFLEAFVFADDQATLLASPTAPPCLVDTREVPLRPHLTSALDFRTWRPHLASALNFRT